MLEELKAYIRDNHLKVTSWVTDEYLLRFCRARQFNSKKVIDMYQNTYNFRQEIGADRLCIDFEFPEEEKLMEVYQNNFFGVDKIGRPFYVDRIGTVRVERLLKIVSEESLWKAYSRMYELIMKHKFLACSDLFDRNIHQTVNVFDIGGFSMAIWNRQSMTFLKKALQISLEHYPELLGKLFIINAPFIFTGVWAIVKSWLDEKTRKKIVMVGKDYLKYMLEYVDEDQIPLYLGGTNQADFIDDFGPWNDYDLIDSDEPGAVVGVRRKGDPSGRVFTPADHIALENPALNGKGVLGCKGAVVRTGNGQYGPNPSPCLSTPIENPEKYIDIPN